MKKLLFISFSLFLVSCVEQQKQMVPKNQLNQSELIKIGEWDIPHGILYKYKIDKDTFFIVRSKSTGHSISIER